LSYIFRNVIADSYDKSFATVFDDKIGIGNAAAQWLRLDR
jgi:hypothetical protein